MKTKPFVVVVTLAIVGTLAVTIANTQQPRREVPGNALPQVRRQINERTVQAMPKSAEAGAVGKDYRITISPRITRRIDRPIRNRWQLGVNSENSPMGIRIEAVTHWTPAYYAGLERGDYILDVNGYPVGFNQGMYYPLEAAFDAHADRDGWVNLGVWNRRTQREEAMWVQLSKR